MARGPDFAVAGEATDSIDVRLSYRIVELFSEGLYTSPNKAIEELVANSFDAGALAVHVILSTNLHHQDATIAVIDDGEGMDAAGLKGHWLIGVSNKRRLTARPRGRQQIGKFGIGKLATYVLASRLTHISKCGDRFYSASMDYNAIDKRLDSEVEPKAPIKIPLRELSEAEAKEAVKTWLDLPALRAAKFRLFGKGSKESWTISIMSSLKDKVHEIKPGTLGWVLRTALPLRPDFGIWLNGKRLVPSKQGKGLLKKWVLGKDLVDLPRPAPKGITESKDAGASRGSPHRFGLEVPGLGRVTGYAEAYKDLLTGKSDELSRSHGFFVYVFGRLLNVVDGHFGISPDELRHGTFGRFRLVVYMDGLDDALRSNREAISEGPLLETAQSVLRAIFNAVRAAIDQHDAQEEPGARLSRKLAATPASISRWPIVELSRAVASGEKTARYLIVPHHDSVEDRGAFLESLEERAAEPDGFVSETSIDFHGSLRDGIVRFDVEAGVLRLNAWHPFVATFHEEFAHKRWGLPLELVAMAEVLAEAQLHSLGVPTAQVDQFLRSRDELLRSLANESGRQSALSVANSLQEARNNPSLLEDRLCDAFGSLGFEVTPLGKPGEPDGVATAYIAADESGGIRQYSVSLEAKSKAKAGTKVSAKTVGISTIARQRDKFNCDHAVVVGPDFPTDKGPDSALSQEIESDATRTAAEGDPKTITLLTIDDLARLVRLRPIKQIGLKQMRSLFTDCQLPLESATWVESVSKAEMTKPPYRRIVETIASLQKKWDRAPVKYAALRVELSHLAPPIEYDTDEKLVELCRAMAQMAPGAMFAAAETVELDQSAENVIAAIDGATQGYPADEQ